MGSNAGAAFVYVCDDSKWLCEHGFSAFDASPSDWFGFAVALNSDYALNGAPQADTQMGAAHVYERIGDTWIFQSKLAASKPTGPFPFLGSAVALSAEPLVAVVGAPCDFALGFESGAAHVFSGNQDRWVETAKLTASNGGPQQSFGLSLALERDTGFVCSPAADQDTGIAYSFIGFARADCNGNGTSDPCDIFVGNRQDENSTSIPDDCESLGDLNGDGIINIVDLFALLASWGACQQPCPPSCSGDTDGSCAVDGFDFLTLLINWTA